MTLPYSLHPLDYPARYQFQSGAPCNGSSTCTDTCIQMIVEYYKDKTYSLSYIRQVAQAKTNFNEAACTGINYIETLNALDALGVTHYKVAWNIDANFVYNNTILGPALVGVYYGNYPRSTTGVCGTSNEAEENGKTDCPFNGSHAILSVARHLHTNSAGVILHRDLYTRDPDHHSATRREAPNYDVITVGQLDKTMKALPANTAFSSTYCLYPTKRKVL